MSHATDSKIYTIHVGTPFGTHKFKITAVSEIAAETFAKRNVLDSDRRLFSDQLRVTHVKSEEWDAERLEIVKLASEKYGVKIVPADIDSDPVEGLTIDGVAALEWLEMLFG